MNTEKEDRMLVASIEDKKFRCMKRYTMENSSFLDLRQRTIIEKICRDDNDIVPAGENVDGRIRYLFYGGYEDAERRILVFMSEYDDIDEVTGGEDCPLALLKVRTSKNSGKLTHRDYLGSLLALGIKREVTGDILVRDDGADIVILKDMCDYLLANYEKAGRTELKVSVADIKDIDTGIINIVEKRDTVASLRLDNLVSSAFGISRSRAQEAVKAGLVSVNSLVNIKADTKIDEGDKLVLRGHGKAILREISGRSRKDRIYVIFDKYV